MLLVLVTMIVLGYLWQHDAYFYFYREYGMRRTHALSFQRRNWPHKYRNTDAHIVALYLVSISQPFDRSFRYSKDALHAYTLINLSVFQDARSMDEINGPILVLDHEQQRMGTLSKELLHKYQVTHTGDSFADDERRGYPERFVTDPESPLQWEDASVGEIEMFLQQRLGSSCQIAVDETAALLFKYAFLLSGNKQHEFFGKGGGWGLLSEVDGYDHAGSGMSSGWSRHIPGRSAAHNDYILWLYWAACLAAALFAAFIIRRIECRFTNRLEV
ncbi:hypothetical protein [Poriferisphaera sp. WC338]|uniref:hypothetical protein n=1 Tax=Poriferisphaera sp. WC338 TaxID=3425129 RepID=UPI003D819A39